MGSKPRPPIERAWCWVCGIRDVPLTDKGRYKGHRDVADGELCVASGWEPLRSWDKK